MPPPREMSVAEKREDEMEGIVDTLRAAAEVAINDSDEWTQEESADMWDRIADEATRWSQQIRSEIE